VTVGVNPLLRPPMFRRRPFQASHQRPGLLRAIARPLALALLLVGVPAALAVWTLTSSRFALRDLRITSGERVPPAEVAASLAPLRGRHVLLLSLPEVERLLANHRWVEGVEVHKKLPDGLVVQVLERVPVAVLRYQGTLHYVDREGRVIDRADSTTAPAALLLIDGEPDRARAVAAAVTAVESLARGDAPHFRHVLGVELLPGPDLRLRLEALPFAVLVRADRLQPAVARFERLLPKILDRYAGLEAVDLRFSRQIVMKFPEA
jgi:POTRA domain, FtsQ-type/Cell division protein FtsQ/DivIB, C-terminal